MDREPFDVRFLPDESVCRATGPLGLDVAAARAGILLEHPCGAQGTCGRCRVRVRSGPAPITEDDRDQIGPRDLEEGWRLGCRLVLDGPATIEVPPVSRSLAGKSFGDPVEPELLARPVVERLAVVLPPNDLSEGALLDRLSSACGLASPLAAKPAVLAELGRAWAAGQPLTMTLEGNELVAASRDEVRSGFGLAVDIGTTSLAAALVDLSDGSVRASGARLNPQVAFGSDVIARIRHAMERDEHLAALAGAVRGGLAGLVKDLVAEVGCDLRDVVVAAVAGNPTMLHAWAGVPIVGLGMAPYAAVWAGQACWKAAEVELAIHPNANVFVFPMIRSHVGGDAVAAAIACDIDQPGEPRLLIDLGTNTELLAVSGERAVVTSAAAGPAFEGVSIRCGMRAAPGAIDLVSLPGDGQVLVNVIGGVAANGLCGSGIVDAVAELLRVGILTPSGAMRKASELPASAAGYGSRLRQIDGQQAFVLASPDEGAAREVVCTARDVREIQLAKGAILTAARLACRKLGLALDEMAEVLVAGAFGNVLRKVSVRGIGLLPGVEPERIRLVGNAAGIGARLALLDAEVRQRASRFARHAEYIDLATDAAYQDTFLRALALPDLGASGAGGGR
ncbi:MAG TPA: ASKHA domain-containing protein [Vicinamibacterales bacterium]|nr:ASKHA domain-containing protein [Vicinamibacterales bacterium]